MLNAHRSSFARLNLRLSLALIYLACCTACYAGEARADAEAKPTRASIPVVAPGLIRIDGGAFVMGAAADDDFNLAAQGPQLQLTVPSFEIAAHELTVAEFRAFVEDTSYLSDAERNTAVGAMGRRKGCLIHVADESEPGLDWISGASWREPGYAQSDRHPVTCVSWNDASAYVAWLSQRTGVAYRLPTEIELEFVQRAGTDTGWAWGDQPELACTAGNLADQAMAQSAPIRFLPKFQCHDGHVFAAAVGSFPANAWGLHETVGNVWEWAEDCYNARYASTPEESSAKADCSRRNHRGGSWMSGPMDARSAYRTASAPSFRSSTGGFRIARSLTEAGK